MDCKFIHVHHGENRIQMHEGSAFREFDGDDFFHLASHLEQDFCQVFNGLRRCPFRNPNGHSRPIYEWDIMGK